MPPSLAAVDGALFHTVFSHIIPEIVDRTVHGYSTCFGVIVAIVYDSTTFGAV